MAKRTPLIKPLQSAGIPDRPKTKVETAKVVSGSNRLKYANKGAYTLETTVDQPFPAAERVEQMIKSLVPPYMANRAK